MLHVEIGRTVCEKRGHSNLDNCHFQRKKNLQQVCTTSSGRYPGITGDPWLSLAVLSPSNQLCYVPTDVQASSVQSQLR